VALAALLAAGCGGSRTGGGTLPTTLQLPPASTEPPAATDFVAFPTCMLYAPRSDTRVRVRAARIERACAFVTAHLSPGWSRRARPAQRILGPLCRFANPARKIEVEVIDDADGGARGGRICSSLAGAGWFDLASP
jgi:hypothetical protein